MLKWVRFHVVEPNVTSICSGSVAHSTRCVLRDAADEADLMEAAARVPVWAPNRAERIVAFLYSKARSIAAVGISAFQVAEVLRFRERPGAAERFEAVAASIPPGDGQLIVSSSPIERRASSA